LFRFWQVEVELLALMPVGHVSEVALHGGAFGQPGWAGGLGQQAEAKAEGKKLIKRRRFMFISCSTADHK